DHQQPAVRGVGPGLPGRADDGGAAGPADPSLPHLRDEWRKLPLPRVDESQEGQGPQEGEIALASPPLVFSFGCCMRFPCRFRLPSPDFCEVCPHTMTFPDSCGAGSSKLSQYSMKSGCSASAQSG